MARVYLYCAAAIFAFATGWASRAVIAERDMAELLAKSNLDYVQSVTDTQRIEHKLQDVTEQINQRGHMYEGDIQRTYSDLSERLRTKPEATSEADPVKPAAVGKQTPTVATCNLVAPRRAFRELRAQLLDIARECDIVKARYNQVISIYEAQRKVIAEQQAYYSARCGGD